VVQVREDIASGDTAKHGAIGAALGGILGGVLGGGKGAVVGVLLGGAGGAITATGDDVELPAGTVFTLQLDRPVTVRR
jgi:outer membrane lipoprotein SlyB